MFTARDGGCDEPFGLSGPPYQETAPERWACVGSDGGVARFDEAEPAAEELDAER